MQDADRIVAFKVIDKQINWNVGLKLMTWKLRNRALWKEKEPISLKQYNKVDCNSTTLHGWKWDF